MTAQRYCCIAGGMFRYDEEPDGRQLYVTLEDYEKLRSAHAAQTRLADARGRALLARAELMMMTQAQVDRLERTLSYIKGRTEIVDSATLLDIRKLAGDALERSAS